jgi:hypothetical protein
MRAWVCFDDTDDLDAPQGTGKLARWFEEELPEGCSLWGVVRQQLLVHPSVPYTSHNSSACCVLDIPGPEVVPDLVALAGAHVERHMLDGSDPGVCVAVEGDDAVDRLVAFRRLRGRRRSPPVRPRRHRGRRHRRSGRGRSDGVGLVRPVHRVQRVARPSGDRDRGRARTGRHPGGTRGPQRRVPGTGPRDRDAGLAAAAAARRAAGGPGSARGRRHLAHLRAGAGVPGVARRARDAPRPRAALIRRSAAPATSARRSRRTSRPRSGTSE